MQVTRVKEDKNCLGTCQILPTSAQRIIWKPLRRIYMLSPAKDASDGPPVSEKRVNGNVNYHFTEFLVQKFVIIVEHCLDQCFY